MELINTTLVVKTPESEAETQPPKTSPFSNGVLKIHAPPHRHHPPVIITYKECLKNHAAALGGHAVDGCGEFMPSPASNPDEPTSLKCAACGCHRNFHRREPEEPVLLLPTVEFRSHHRHHPPPPRSPDNSPSPPPISSAYYPSALLALHNPTAAAINAASMNLLSPNPNPNSSRKRFRTRFNQVQKEKMLELAERLEWKMQKKDEDMINEICGEIGVEKGVFKVWMHNNKSSSSKRDPNIAIATPPAVTNDGNGVSDDDSKHNVHRREDDIVGNPGSSSST